MSGVFIGQPTSVSEEGLPVLPPTLPPLSGVPGSSVTGVIPGGGSGGAAVPIATPSAGCAVSVAVAFGEALSSDPTIQAVLGCPRDAGTSLTLVGQRFQQGQMLWRDTRQIVALAQNRQYWRVADTWNEGLPAEDPALTPPEGLLQPVRGFGFVWRADPTFQAVLGWATAPELPFSSTWQEFEGGSLLLGLDGLVYAVPVASSGQYLGGVAP
ncbi:MAG: hypothetical protein HC915_04775 [Anaerolineae bacterium]|nr:hypothetical protein [Anaerolineae bacterium]